MKILSAFAIIFLFYFIKSNYAQAPQAIPYQGVARDNTGNIIANHSISLRFSIRNATTLGTIVYKETQNTVTNSFGLFTVTIGQGTVVSGIFANIDWGGGSKFIQVEMDAAGGSNYTDMGTQQMESVPYALNAANGNWNKSGNDIFNSNIGNIGIGTNSPQYICDIFVPSNTSGTGLDIHTNLAGDATGYIRFSNTSNNNNAGTFSSFIGGERFSSTGHSLVFGTGLLGSIPTEKMRIQGNGNVGIGTTSPSAKLEVNGQVKIIGGTPGAGKVLTADANGLATWEQPQSENCTYTIGQNVPALGGFIFYLDGSGCHGLVCTPTDQSTGIQWNNGTHTINSLESGLGIGYVNTKSIVYYQGAGSYAAYKCDTLSLGGFTDWYLPSIYELKLIFFNVGPGAAAPNTNVGGFANQNYWSSTEVNSTKVWLIDILSGSQVSFDKIVTFGYVRAVRAF